MFKNVCGDGSDHLLRPCKDICQWHGRCSTLSREGLMRMHMGYSLASSYPLCRVYRAPLQTQTPANVVRFYISLGSGTDFTYEISVLHHSWLVLSDMVMILMWG